MPFNRIITKGFQSYWRYSRGLGLGVAGYVADAGGRVLLVRRQPKEAWRLPGGTVLKGESATDALRRILSETAGLAIAEAPRLFAVYAVKTGSSPDHTALFIVPSWRLQENAAGEYTASAALFEHDRLPHETEGAARRRIEEVRTDRHDSEIW